MQHTRLTVVYLVFNPKLTKAGNESLRKMISRVCRCEPKIIRFSNLSQSDTKEYIPDEIKNNMMYLSVLVPMGGDTKEGDNIRRRPTVHTDMNASKKRLRIT